MGERCGPIDPSTLAGAAPVSLLSILCPRCRTPLARASRPDGIHLMCLECGLTGDYARFVEGGGLAGGTLSRREIDQLRLELGGLRDQAARAEAMDRGD